MATIAGASKYLNAARVANARKIAVQAPNLLGQQNITTTSLLESGRRLAAGRFGLSGNGRAINKQFLNNSSTINALLSLGAGPSATIEGAGQEILALRSKLSDAQLARDLRGSSVDDRV